MTSPPYISGIEAGLAVPHLVAATKANPKCAVAYANLAIAYLMQGRHAEAEIAARSMADLDRTSTRSRLILGMTLVMSDKFTDETENLLSRAEADYPQATLLLGRIRAERGDFNGAEAKIEHYLSTSAPVGREMAEEWLSVVSRAERVMKERQTASVR